MITVWACVCVCVCVCVCGCVCVCVRDSIALRIKERFASSPRDAREISLLYRVSTKRVYTRVYIHACMSVDIESIIAFETSYSTPMTKSERD